MRRPSTLPRRPHTARVGYPTGPRSFTSGSVLNALALGVGERPGWSLEDALNWLLASRNGDPSENAGTPDETDAIKSFRRLYEKEITSAKSSSLDQRFSKPSEAGATNSFRASDMMDSLRPTSTSADFASDCLTSVSAEDVATLRPEVVQWVRKNLRGVF